MFFPTSLRGILVFDSVSRLLLLRLRLRLRLRRLLFLNHHLSHTICIFHTHFCQPPSFTHYLSHTSLSTTISHTHSTTISHTHIFVTHHLSHTTTHHLSHATLSTTISGTHLCHTPSSTTISHTHLCQPPSFTHHLCHTPALGDICLRFAWQAWHLETSTFVLRFNHHVSHTTLSTTITHTHLCHTPALGYICLRHLCHTPALGDICVGFAWQASHLETSTFVLRGRRATACTWWRAWSPLVIVGRR